MKPNLTNHYQHELFMHIFTFEIHIVGRIGNPTKPVLADGPYI